MARALLACVAAGALASCSDARLIMPAGGRRFSNADSLRLGLVRKRAGTHALHDDDPTVGVASTDPGTFIGFSQPDPITITFFGPVHSVTIIGDGAITCSGDQGRITGYDADGNVLGSAPLTLIDPSDCSPEDNPDNVTFGAQATLVTTGVMVKAIITPMSLLEFPVFDLVGHASQSYTIEVGGGAPLPTASVDCNGPVERGSKIACTVKVDPQQPFTVTQRASSGDRYSFTSNDRIDSDGTPYVWDGIAVIDTHVSITVSVTQNGTETPLAPATADFSVTARTGPQWTGLKIQATAPEPIFVDGAPLLANPFPNRGTLQSPDGALGQYVHDLSFNWGLVPSGPNTNIVYTRLPASVNPSIIYVHAWLQAGSRFYNAQAISSNTVIGNGPCLRSDIDKIRIGVIDHEKAHYAADKKFFDEHDVQQLLEAAHSSFDASTIGQPGADKAQRAAEGVAEDAAYGTAWTAVAKTAVDANPVRLSGCTPAQP